MFNFLPILFNSKKIGDSEVWSQPIKAFDVVAVFVVCVLVFVVVLGHRNLTSKFGQNRVRNS